MKYVSAGVWEDEVQEDALGIGDGIDLKALGIMHGFWRVDVRYGVRGESVQELWWGGREQFLVGRAESKSGAEAGSKFIREKREWFAKKADVLVGQTSEFSFEEVTAGTCAGLFPITCENLKAVSREKSGQDGESSLPSLLCFVIDGKTTEKEESREKRMGRGTR